jgi:hypothetical protein
VGEPLQSDACVSTEPGIHPRPAIDYATRASNPAGQPAVAVLTAGASVCPAGQYERVSMAAARALLRAPGRALGFADVRLVRSALIDAWLL